MASSRSKKVALSTLVAFVALSIQGCSASNHSSAFESICKNVVSANQVLASNSDSITPDYVEQDRILTQAKPVENQAMAASQSGSGSTLLEITNLFSGSDDLARGLNKVEQKESPELKTLEQVTNRANAALLNYLTAPEDLSLQALQNWLLESQHLNLTLSNSQFKCGLK